MAEKIDGHRIREILLKILDEFSIRGATTMQSSLILSAASKQLGIQSDIEHEQALLTFWHDLFRTGYLAWGYNLSNAEPPFCHLTTQGRKILENLSRDPANPNGYLAHLSKLGKLDSVVYSYVQEALKTYTSDCFKATAVMIGAAAESIIIDLRDTLVKRMIDTGKTPPKNLQDWQIKRVLNAFKQELDNYKKDMPQSLVEAFEAYWSAFTQFIRTTRNEAGHPMSVQPVTLEAVHSSLLIFPELAKLGFELKSWVLSNYK